MVADANYPELPYAAPGAWAPNFLPPGEYDEIDKAINALLVEDPLIDIDTTNIWASLPAYDNMGDLPFNYNDFDLN